MIVRSKFIVASVASAIAIAGFAGTAQADDTPTTFEITAGTLAIAVPAAADFGDVAAGAPTVGGSLGVVTVTDNRGALNNSWSTTASSTTFTTGAATATETVSIASVGYATGTGTGTGTGTFTPASALGAVAWVGGNGVNTTTWNPTITLTLRADQVAGVYAGTITHSAL